MCSGGVWIVTCLNSGLILQSSDFSLESLSRRIQEEKLAKELIKQQEHDSGQNNDDKKDEDKSRPNPILCQGVSLPTRMGEFPPELFGIPIEDIDEYYHNKYVSSALAPGFQIIKDFSLESSL